MKPFLLRAITSVLALAVLSVPGVAHAHQATAAFEAPRESRASKPLPRLANKNIKLVPGEPRTAKAYAKMFDLVPTDEWGGGDVTISTRLSDGRRLWLHGDTFSKNNGFVHSSALVQTGSYLNVVNDGRQILPNHEDQPTDGTKRIYWIETVRAEPGSMVTITAAPMSVTPGDPWGFERFHPGSRQALVHVDSYGNTQFVRWTKWVKRPSLGMDGEDMKVIGPNHFTYAVFVHDIRLKNKRFLRTRNQNWDDAIENHVNSDGTFRYTDWRPLFDDSRTRLKPYWGR